MSDWQNYGFTQNDLALLPIQPSLNAFILALKERFELLGLTNNAAYQYILDYVNGNYILLANELAIPSSSGADYSTCFLCLIDYLLSFLMPSGNTSLFGINHSYFLTKANYDYTDITVRRSRDLIDAAVSILANEGFTSSRITLYSTINKNYSVALSNVNRQNKHWAIQRQKVLNMLRYALIYHGILSPYNRYVYKYNPNSNYNTIQDAYNDLSREREINFSSMSDLEYAFVRYNDDGTFKITVFADSILVNKNVIDNFTFVHGKQFAIFQNLNSDIIGNMNFDFESFDFVLNFWYGIDFDNVITRDGVDYYKAKFPFDYSKLVNMVLNQNYQHLTDYGYTPYRVAGQINTDLYELLDGADYFSFLDV